MTTPLTGAGAHDSTVRIAVPAKGRLRDNALDLLSTAGYRVEGLRGRGSIARSDQFEIIEMRPRDAATALAAGTLDGAFAATDIAMEHDITGLARLPLGSARSRLILAVKDDAGLDTLADLDGGVVATHMPHLTAKFLADAGIDATVLSMGGSLEGLCAAGLADAIVDNTETGTSLRQNKLTILATIAECEAEFIHRADVPVLDDLEFRLQAALRAKAHRYVMLHIPEAKVAELTTIFSGLAAPTILPLAGRDDLVAAHFVVSTDDLWARLSSLNDLGATGIVALQPDALAP